MQQSVLSKEYIKTAIAAVVDGLNFNPTADSVQMAFPAAGVAPIFSDWNAASWETDADGVHWARCLVGPGGVVALPVGRYGVWVKISDSPEVPVIYSGRLDIT